MTTWQMRAAYVNGYFSDVGRPHIELINPSDWLTDVDVAEIEADDTSGTHWGWIPAGEDKPVMIRPGLAAYRMQFTYGCESEERRGRGRTVRLRVTLAEGSPS